MTFSPRIRELRATDFRPDPMTRRPRVISSDHANGIIMVYAEWCPYCRMFKPWYNAFADSQAPENVLLGVISSDDVQDVFEDGEVPGFPCFKRVVNGTIDRSEVPINRATQEAAFESLRNVLTFERETQRPIEALENRLHQIELVDRDEGEVRRLRAELAKAAALEAVYQRQLVLLQEQLRICEERTLPTAPAPVKRKVAAKKSPKPVSRKRASKTKKADAASPSRPRRRSKVGSATK